MRPFVPLAIMFAIVLPLLASAQMPNPSVTTIPAPTQPGVIALAVVTGTADREIWHLDNGLVAVRNVTMPTLRPFRPVGHASRAAMIIAPGVAFWDSLSTGKAGASRAGLPTMVSLHSSSSTACCPPRCRRPNSEIS